MLKGREHVIKFKEEITGFVDLMEGANILRCNLQRGKQR
jgi:hypothetical protein